MFVVPEIVKLNVPECLCSAVHCKNEKLAQEIFTFWSQPQVSPPSKQKGLNLHLLFLYQDKITIKRKTLI